jgi:hypothetical protein
MESILPYIDTNESRTLRFQIILLAGTGGSPEDVVKLARKLRKEDWDLLAKGVNGETWSQLRELISGEDNTGKGGEKQ